MIKILGTMAVASAVLLLANTENAEAQGYVGSGCSSCNNFGLLGSPYALGRVPDPPYFAIHPPVYYSVPVARTYGYSPYAYPGSVRTPEVQVQMPTAKVMKNPYVTPTAKPKKDFQRNLTMKKVSEPEVVDNPFVAEKTRLVNN